jgi:hypothetical protein
LPEAKSVRRFAPQTTARRFTTQRNPYADLLRKLRLVGREAMRRDGLLQAARRGSTPEVAGSSPAPGKTESARVGADNNTSLDTVLASCLLPRRTPQADDVWGRWVARQGGSEGPAKARGKL